MSQNEQDVAVPKSSPPLLRITGSGRTATYALNFLTAPDAQTAYRTSALAAAIAAGGAFGGPPSATDPALERTSGFSGDQYDQFLTFGVPASEWGQVAGAQLDLTSPALNLSPVTVYQIDNIPNVFAQIGDTANATATPGAVQLTIDNVQNLLLDATGSPYGALDTIFTAAPPGEGGVIAIRSGPAGGYYVINPVGFGTPDVPAPAGFSTNGLGETLIYQGGSGNDSLLLGQFAGRALIALGGNDGTFSVQALPVGFSGPTPLIPPDAGPATDSAQLNNSWQVGNYLLGDFSIVGTYAAGTSAARTTTINRTIGATGRVGVFASPIDVSGSAPINGFGIADPNATPAAGTGDATDLGLNGGYSVDGQTGHDELAFNWSAATQVGSATLTLGSTSAAALQSAQLGVELFNHGTEVYSAVLSPGAASVAGPGPESGTYVAAINLDNLTDSQGKPISWNAMTFIGEPAAPGSASVLLDTLTLNSVPQLFVEGGDNASLGGGDAVLAYDVGHDGVQAIDGFAFGQDRLLLQHTSVADIVGTQYGDRYVLTFENAPGGAVVLNGVTDVTLAQHLHAVGGNVVLG